MGRNRLEAFSDGVIAIIVTIMVLELKLPDGDDWSSLAGLWPHLASYALSFVVVAIYWVSHHHLIHLTARVDRRLLWLNNLWLFWLSLIPLATEYLGTRHGSPLSVAAYGCVMSACGLSFNLLRGRIVKDLPSQERGHPLHRRYDRRNAFSLALYIASVPLAFVEPSASVGIFVAVALAYFLPDDSDFIQMISEHDDGKA